MIQPNCKTPLFILLVGFSSLWFATTANSQCVNSQCVGNHSANLVWQGCGSALHAPQLLASMESCGSLQGYNAPVHSCSCSGVVAENVFPLTGYPIADACLQCADCLIAPAVEMACQANESFTSVVVADDADVQITEGTIGEVAAPESDAKSDDTENEETFVSSPSDILIVAPLEKPTLAEGGSSELVTELNQAREKIELLQEELAEERVKTQAAADRAYAAEKAAKASKADSNAKPQK